MPLTNPQFQYLLNMLQVYPPWRGVFWPGAAGTGKSFAAKHWAESLDPTPESGIKMHSTQRQYKAQVWRLRRLLRFLTVGGGADRAEAWSEFEATALRGHFIVLDEIGWEDPYLIRTTEEIMDFLIEECRGFLVFISNLSLDGLKDVYSEATLSRFYRLHTVSWPADLPDLRVPGELARNQAAQTPPEMYGLLDTWATHWLPQKAVQDTRTLPPETP
jgi:hypothetical protein